MLTQDRLLMARQNSGKPGKLECLGALRLRDLTWTELQMLPVQLAHAG